MKKIFLAVMFGCFCLGCQKASVPVVESNPPCCTKCECNGNPNSDNCKGCVKGCKKCECVKKVCDCKDGKDCVCTKEMCKKNNDCPCSKKN